MHKYSERRDKDVAYIQKLFTGLKVHNMRDALQRMWELGHYAGMYDAGMVPQTEWEEKGNQ